MSSNKLNYRYLLCSSLKFIENNKFSSKRINSSVQENLYKKFIFDSINNNIISFGIIIIGELFEDDYYVYIRIQCFFFLVCEPFPTKYKCF